MEVSDMIIAFFIPGTVIMFFYIFFLIGAVFPVIIGKDREKIIKMSAISVSIPTIAVLILLVDVEMRPLDKYTIAFPWVLTSGLLIGRSLSLTENKWWKF
jgi:hypothetical protein